MPAFPPETKILIFNSMLFERQVAPTPIYREEISGATRERPQLKKLLEQVRHNDVVVIWKLDRLGRSLADLLHLVTEIQEKGAGLLSLHDNIDTTTPQGKLTFHIFAAIAEFEREIIRERAKTGLASARAEGVKVAGHHVFQGKRRSKLPLLLLYIIKKSLLLKSAPHFPSPKRLFTSTFALHRCNFDF